ncbi:unnamed protein product [Cochlearia groenlandica]
MDKGEPSLAPEWLRSSGHVSGLGSSSHFLVSSSSSSSSHSGFNIRNSNSIRTRTDVDSIHSPFLDRSSSTNSTRCPSSNGSAKHAYSSFNRSYRDKDRGRDKDKGSYVDQWDFDTFIPLKNILTGRDQDKFRRSHSMVTSKHVSNNGGTSNSFNGPSIGSSFHRYGFDKDFPSLGADEKHDFARVSSPGLSSVVQSLPVGNSALIGGEGWTSALAEVPNVIVKACSPKANAVSTRALAGLNMAEALVQAPARTCTPPQGSVKTQRLEDLAIKQSRQLIPVVPSAQKCSSLNHSDKSKTKQVVRTGETCLSPSRNAQQQQQQQPSGNQLKTEKKLLVLKPSRENGIAAVKESGSPTDNTKSRAVCGQQIAQSTQSAPHVRSTHSPKDVKGTTTLTIEKKSSSSHTQSRNAFYSALKQKTTSTNSFSSVEEKVNNSSNELKASSDPSSPLTTSDVEVTQITSQVVEKKKNNTGFEVADTPDEEEAEFLRSLGWDENNCEDEALTMDEILAFREQYEKLRNSPSNKT